MAFSDFLYERPWSAPDGDKGPFIEYNLGEGVGKFDGGHYFFFQYSCRGPFLGIPVGGYSCSGVINF